MAIDAERGSFVKDEFRFIEKSAPDVLALKPDARIIELETNLDLAACEVLAVELLDEHKHVAQVYNITIEGVDFITPSDFVDSPVTVTCNFPDWPVSQTDKLTVVAVSHDYTSWTTTITARGPIK
ncbi:hypothetical protein AX777_05880 [Sphingobium yanoikuyae]|uniref:Uncharacterized protein n=1 Tax=Sphingobium yanoikuyae TaxID=13690 RepID=A0A177JPR8_SPHYA|nr:hypothetical protein [Sphingobium yanoikuyae]OAH42766.1 hypothetical protein AX777_05880 [Sphingobium yanoikuyae]